MPDRAGPAKLRQRFCVRTASTQIDKHFRWSRLDRKCSGSRSEIMRRFLPDTFTLMLVTTVIIASFLPAHGQFAEIFGYATDCAIALLFFLHGARLSRDVVIAGVFTLAAASDHSRGHLRNLSVAGSGARLHSGNHPEAGTLSWPAVCLRAAVNGAIFHCFHLHRW